MKLTVLVLTSCVLAACSKQAATTAETEAPEPAAAEKDSNAAVSAEEGSCCSGHDAPQAVKISEDSVYQITSRWQDSAGKERLLKSLGGHVQVVTMGYTTCKYACPRLLADMREIEQKLPEEVRAKTYFTFISIDPETDTPARLAEYFKENKLTSQRWTALRGETDSIQELAVVLGVQYRKSSEKDFAHSNVITVLNSNGEIVHRQEGLGADSGPTVKAITAAQ